MILSTHMQGTYQSKVVFTSMYQNYYSTLNRYKAIETEAYNLRQKKYKTKVKYFGSDLMLMFRVDNLSLWQYSDLSKFPPIDISMIEPVNNAALVVSSPTVTIDQMPELSTPEKEPLITLKRTLSPNSRDGTNKQKYIQHSNQSPFTSLAAPISTFPATPLSTFPAAPLATFPCSQPSSQQDARSNAKVTTEDNISSS